MLSKAFFRENPGFTQFLVRTVIFAAVVMGVNLFIFLYFRHTTFFYEFLRLPDFFYFDFLSGLRKRDFINAAAFSGIVFIIWNWKYLLKLKGYKQDVKQSVIFGVAAFAMLVAHYVFKFIMTGHLAFGAKYSLLMTLVKYSFNIGFVFLVFVAVFGWTFVKKQGFHFRYQIPIFIFILASYFFLIQFFNNIWRILGNMVASVVHYMLSLTFSDTYIDLAAERAPRIGVGDFKVAISEECSGIDSLLLFISLYGVLLALDWKNMHVKRMLFLLIPGLIGTVLYNILRIYLLMLVGILYSVEFAIDVFHSNIGWMLFLVFFVIFWHFGSAWVYKKRGDREKA